jgi:hypothetical protein
MEQSSPRELCKVIPTDWIGSNIIRSISLLLLRIAMFA